jgi:DNA-binding CsgD family transcriptional regulator/tetratricopeptide (TPR) repeat protein
MCAGVSQLILIAVDSIRRSPACTQTSLQPSTTPGSTISAGTPSGVRSRGLYSEHRREAGLFAPSGDTSSVRMRLSSSRFVGRAGELAELQLAVREAADGQPVLVLLGGESGVGKTRLIDELARRLSLEDATVLRGDAVEQGDGELPYAPILSALRPLVRERHPAFAALGPGSRAALAALLPGFDDVQPPVDVQDPTGQLRLFEALLELLHLLSEAEPLALILEDMHWADRSTRAFVTFLARSLREERLMLLLSFRTDELHRRHALRPLLAELERLGWARRIELEPFDRDELTEALTDILGDVPASDLVERLYERGEGNALYTEELLAAGLDGRGAAPGSLRDAFLLRIERLSPDAQRVARAVASGGRLRENVIAEVTGVDDDTLTAAIREAVDQQVLVSAADERLLFRHALLREVVVHDLLPGERCDLHLALARAFEHDDGELEGGEIERAAQVAHHYAAAGDQPAALRATVEAALAARNVHAHGEVAELADRALDLWPRVPDAPALVGLDHAEVLFMAADAHALAGDPARGELLLRAALAEVDPQTDRRRYAAMLARLARALWTLNRGEEAVRTGRQALLLLPEGEGGHDRALLLAWFARTLFLRGRVRDSVRDGEEAHAAAVGCADRRAEGDVLNTLGMAQIALGNVEEGEANLRQALAIAREIDDLDRLGGAYTNLADSLGVVGRTLTALETAREGLAAMPRHGRLDWIRLTVSELAYEAGDWPQAQAQLDAVPEQLAGLPFMFRQLTEAQLALGEGSEALAAQRLEQVEALVSASTEPQWIGAHGALLGELRRRGGDFAGARAAVAHALDRIELCTEDVVRIARVTAVGLRVEADVAQRSRDLHERDEGRDAIARARIHMQRLEAAAQDGGPVEAAWRTVGAADLARARGRSSAAAWRAAAAAWEAISRPYPAAVARWHETLAHVEADDRVLAAEVAQGALAVADRLGSRWLAAELTLLAERARLDLGGAGTPAPPRNGATEDPFGLTPRERQVLALLAQGATNRQIGAALFMAEKTASVHVSRILSKLDVRSRTQAAAVAHRLHLA